MSVTISSIVHTIRERMPEHGIGAGRALLGRGGHRLAQRVERAGADVAVDDTDGAERQRPELPVPGVAVLGAVRRGGRLCHAGRYLEWCARGAEGQGGRGLYTSACQG